MNGTSETNTPCQNTLTNLKDPQKLPHVKLRLTIKKFSLELCDFTVCYQTVKKTLEKGLCWGLVFP